MDLSGSLQFDRIYISGLYRSIIHASVPHIGGVANFKFEFAQIPGLSKLVGEKTAQFGFRFGSGNLVGAFATD